MHTHRVLELCVCTSLEILLCIAQGIQPCTCVAARRQPHRMHGFMEFAGVHVHGVMCVQ